MAPSKNMWLLAIFTTFLPTAMSACPYMRASQNRNLNDATTNNITQSTNSSHIGTVYLTNDDFINGTYRIIQPGKYVIQEDIIFAPNTATDPNNPDDILHCCNPRSDQFESNGGKYPDIPFSMGFFSAITVEADEVEIDLNNHKIEQSKEHALMQRFFSVIELANAPFIPGQGPRNFGDEIISGNKIHIHDGKIGRSSHHGIHGNGNHDVKISNVDFVDFEVAAMGLNGVKGLKVVHCTAKSREDVPVLGTFSSALFILRYIQALDDDAKNQTTLKVQGQEKTVADIRTELENSIVNVYEDVVKNDEGFINKDEHPSEYALFHNRHKVIDGNSYGFLTNHLGAAVGGFPYSKDGDDELDHSNNVVFEDVSIISLKAAISEVVALWISESNEAVKDPLGALFQVRNDHPDDPKKPVTISTLDDDTRAEYTGNVVANAQLLVAKCIMKGEVPDDVLLPTQSNKINQDIINWAEAGNTTQPQRYLSNLLDILAPGESGYACNGDSMFHVNKGAIGFKIDNTDNAKLKYCDVYNLMNVGGPGSKVCGDYEKSHPDATYPGYGGANVRGFSFAGSKRAFVYKCFASNIKSNFGSVIGYDVQTDSKKIDLIECHEAELEARGKGGVNSLTPLDACGLMFRESTNDCKLRNHCFPEPVANNGIAEKVLNEGVNNIVVNNVCSPGE